MTISLGSGGGDDQRNARAHFEKRSGLGPFALFAQLIAMIDREDHDCILAQAQAIELSQDTSQIPVGPRDGRDVGPNDFLRLGDAGAPSDKKICVSLANRRRRKPGRNRRPCGKIGSEFDFIDVVEI